MGEMVEVRQDRRMTPAKLAGSLPAWLDTRIGDAELTVQRDIQTGEYRRIWTLPSHKMPSKTERSLISAKAAELDRLLKTVPATSEKEGDALLVVITKMMLSLPSQKTTEAGAEATAEAYEVALEDRPLWATEAARRGWYRGEYGDEYDYAWKPCPADWRKLATLEMLRVTQRRAELQHLLEAQPRIEYPEEHREMMRKKFEALMAELMSFNAVDSASVGRSQPGHAARVAADLAQRRAATGQRQTEVAE